MALRQLLIKLHHINHNSFLNTCNNKFRRFYKKPAMNKQPTLTLIESLFGQSTEFALNKFELYKLKLVDKTSNVASSIITGVVLFVVFFIFFVILNIGIALLIGDLIGKNYLGFLILAVIYAIVGFVIFKSRKKFFKAPILKMLVSKIL